MFAFNIKPNGKECFFGEETGTPEFYHIVDVLKKYLGENIYVSWDYNDFYFIIENIERDEGYDETYDYITIIESIYEPFEYDSGIFIQYKNDHIVFDIIDVIDN